jgi:hemolysin activation/secretion protein
MEARDQFVKPSSFKLGTGFRVLSTDQRDRVGHTICELLAHAARGAAALAAFAFISLMYGWNACAAETPEPRFNIQSYVVKGGASLSSNTVNSILAMYVGTNVPLSDLAKAAATLQFEYAKLGYTNLSVAIAQDQITKGLVTVNLFRGRKPQILISGKRYETSNLDLALAPTPSTGTNAPTGAKTNAPVFLTVRAYEITGDTLLSTNTLMSIFAKRTGTNVTINDILAAASELQEEYRARGYPTVVVSLPQQKLTNEMVKIRVFEGRLSAINVAGNRYFSSNNVMRSLPSLHTNVILSGPLLQSELDRANANQDRQIYAEMQPGNAPDTTELMLRVKDRLPLHGKVDFNNQSSPGTPELRVNTSASYNNLWQLDHSLGVQYSFSPTEFKTGDNWAFYDRPAVANYSGFYRLPLGNFAAVENTIANSAGTFGYSEATRRFNLPPSTGRPELNVYGSRSTIDTGVDTLSQEVIFNVPGVRQVTRKDVQQDLTINEALGFRLSLPLPEIAKWRSTFSGGLDYKKYSLTSNKTNLFSFTEITLNPDGTPNPPIVSTVASPVPTTQRATDYLPLTVRWDGTRPDKFGSTTLSLSYSPNLGSKFFFGSSKFSTVAGSLNANGYYHILNPSLTRDQVIYKDWRLGVRLDGQWANQPLISNEQFGIGGINGVRGYREGEIFGDTGWRVTSEVKTPPQVIGIVYGKNPLIVRGSIFMDYAEAYYLDPIRQPDRIPLWGTGFGWIATIGAHWEARMLFSWPLYSTATTEADQPRFDFSLNFQF